MLCFLGVDGRARVPPAACLPRPCPPAQQNAEKKTPKKKPKQKPKKPFSHRKKRMKQLKKMVQRGLLDPEREDPFALFVASTPIRYCY